jgi:hypothetical protein
MSVPKYTWKIIGDAREHYMTVEASFEKMDRDEQITWLSITGEIEDQIKIAKSSLEAIIKPEEHKEKLNVQLDIQGSGLEVKEKPEEHKRNLVKPIQNQDKLKESNP